MPWSDIDFDEGTIRTAAKQSIAGVPDWRPKHYDARTIPVPDEIVGLLRALRVEAGFGSKMAFVSSVRLAWMQQRQNAGKWKEGQLTLNNLGRGFRAIARVRALRRCLCTTFDAALLRTGHACSQAMLYNGWPGIAR